MSGYCVAESKQILGVTAQQAGLARCNACGTLHRLPALTPCRCCGAMISTRKHLSLQRTVAFLLIGMMLYLPANFLPVMNTRSLTSSQSDTIISGVFTLLREGSYVVAAVVFVASICIPIAKFVIIGMLALSLHFRWDMSEHTRHLLHNVTEFIGRWSMIDVFVVAVLAALLQLGAILSITPGPGIGAFALSVVFTMLAASSLDPRLIWDEVNRGR